MNEYFIFFLSLFKLPHSICSDTGEATLRIIGVASEDDGVYTCVATNELGSVASSASLRVLGERAAAAGPGLPSTVAAADHLHPLHSPHFTSLFS